ncbi:Proenkephalin-A [Pteropus alecto]|uniref:Proenkephalin-A n=1 Tax=Pteropus alecto TaxID=9402 RepID=L5JVI8_PTEAL|nr:Proenkephalin-A [Pteropus alecto]
MARFLRLCTWLLALGPGLLATVQAECSQDCATCSYRLARPTDINPLACTLECEGKLPSLKTWETCRELLQLSKLELPQGGASTLRESSKQEESHLLAKKYGGFMKRYGGFMKKMDELYPLEPEEEANEGEIFAKRYGGFMKKDVEEDDGLGNSSDLLKELLGTGDNRESSHHQEGSDDQEVSKRYGGFMRGLKRSPQLEDEAKELQKRYGGFMRRVGRPEWWMDYQKRYGGFLKRFADSLPSDEEEYPGRAFGRAALPNRVPFSLLGLSAGSLGLADLAIPPGPSSASCTVVEHNQEPKRQHAHVGSMVKFAFALVVKPNAISKHSFNDFRLRVGVNHGPVIAGVIGAQKPQYDIWGKARNVARGTHSTVLLAAYRTCVCFDSERTHASDKLAISAAGRGEEVVKKTREKIKEEPRETGPWAQLGPVNAQIWPCDRVLRLSAAQEKGGTQIDSCANPSPKTSSAIS